MNNRNTDDFWNGLRNITTISNLISKKREEDEKREEKIPNEIVLSTSFDYIQNWSRFYNIMTMTNPQIRALTLNIFDSLNKPEVIEESCIDRELDSQKFSKKELDKLSRIDLLMFIYSLVNTMNAIVPSTYNIFKDHFLLAAIAHSAGKSEKIRVEYDLKNKYTTSADYLELKMNQINLKQADQKIVMKIINILSKQYQDEEAETFEMNNEEDIIDEMLKEKIDEAYQIVVNRILSL